MMLTSDPEVRGHVGWIPCEGLRSIQHTIQIDFHLRPVVHRRDVMPGSQRYCRIAVEADIGTVGLTEIKAHLSICQSEGVGVKSGTPSVTANENVAPAGPGCIDTR